jgi:outer membrane protein assembly factor BamB
MNAQVKLLLARRVFIVCATFCAVSVAVLTANYMWQLGMNVSNSPEIAELRDALGDSPDEAAATQERLRAYDMMLRRTYFAHELVRTIGVWMLCAGVVGLLAAGHAMVAFGPRDRAKPGKSAPPEGPWAQVAAISLTAAALVAAAWAVATLGPRVTITSPVAATPAKLPSADELRRNWWSFRGPGGLGVWPDEAPMDFDRSDGRNVLWSAPVPLAGWSSPVVWGKRVLLTGASQAKREVYCFDADTGRLTWSFAVRAPRAARDPLPNVFEETGLAAPTCVVDGYRVFAMFATGEVACLNLDGSLVWVRYLGPLATQYGHASSPTMHDGKLILQLDQGDSEPRGVLVALDALTGKIIWRVPRPVPSSWASPIVADAPGGPQIITAGKPLMVAYDPRDGAELWRAECLGGDVAPSPVYAGGLAVAASAGSSMTAVATSSRGDATGAAAWRAEESLPEIASPVAYGQWVFTIGVAGTLTCRTIADGKIVWEHDTDAQCRASPVVAGGKLYLLSRNGTMIVCRAGDSWEPLATSELNESVEATPAFSNGRMFIRGERNLYCIGR